MDHQDDILANILDQHQDDELQVIADQCKREIAAGKSVDETLTESQYALGLSYEDVQRVEAMVTDGIDKYAGLKSTLRKLRQQLNKHDHEDVEGLAKLITCIEGVEKQLDRKQKAKDERKSKKAPAEPAEEKEAEAAGEPLNPNKPIPEPSKPGTPGETPMDHSDPGQAPSVDPSVAPSSLDLAAKAIDFALLKKKLEELKKDLETNNELGGPGKSINFPEQEREFETKTKPDLKAYLAAVDDHRLLVEHAERKWSLLLVEGKAPEPQVDKAKLLEGIEKRIAEAVQKGIKFAEELDRSIKAMKGSSAYKTEPPAPTPTLRLNPTPKQHLLDPHHKASRRVTAEMLDSLFEGLDEAMYDIMDLMFVAEQQLKSSPAY